MPQIQLQCGEQVASHAPELRAGASMTLPGGDTSGAYDAGGSAGSTSTALLEAVDKLKFFLATAPGSFDASPASTEESGILEDHYFNRFPLPTGEQISCTLWNGLYHITGTDIVRALNFRFLAFGRPVKNVKKFEEGIFSDLRNLKAGTDATLEEPKSDFLEMLFKHNCIRTQKKQKVFYWFSVPHDRLFLDALDRDLKREKLGLDTTTQAVAEPALSFVYNPSKTLFEQFAQSSAEASDIDRTASDGLDGSVPCLRMVGPNTAPSTINSSRPPTLRSTAFSDSLLGAFSLFEGSPTYKQRRKTTAVQPNARKVTSTLSRQVSHPASMRSQSALSEQHRGQTPTFSPSSALEHRRSHASVAAFGESGYLESATCRPASHIHVQEDEIFAQDTRHQGRSMVLPSPVAPHALSPADRMGGDYGGGSVADPATAEFMIPTDITSSTPFTIPHLTTTHRSRFWTEPPVDHEGWPPYSSGAHQTGLISARGQSTGPDYASQSPWFEPSRRYQSAAPSMHQAAYGFGWASPAYSTSEYPASAVSFGSAFSAIAALADPSLVESGMATSGARGLYESESRFSIPYDSSHSDY